MSITLSSSADLPFAREWQFHSGRGVCHIFNSLVIPNDVRATRVGAGKPRELVFLDPTSTQGVFNRFRQSSAVKPSTRITFLGLDWPDAMVTDERGTFKRFAKNSIQASLARPSMGGAVNVSFSASPSSPVMAFFLPRGWTLTVKTTPDSHSRIGIIEWLSPRSHQGSEKTSKTPTIGSSLCSSVPSVVRLLSFLHLCALPCPLWLGCCPFSISLLLCALCG